jgi:hypothetical protein
VRLGVTQTGAIPQDIAGGQRHLPVTGVQRVPDLIAHEEVDPSCSIDRISHAAHQIGVDRADLGMVEIDHRGAA